MVVFRVWARKGGIFDWGVEVWDLNDNIYSPVTNWTQVVTSLTNEPAVNAFELNVSDVYEIYWVGTTNMIKNWIIFVQFSRDEKNCIQHKNVERKNLKPKLDKVCLMLLKHKIFILFAFFHEETFFYLLFHLKHLFNSSNWKYKYSCLSCSFIDWYLLNEIFRVSLQLTEKVFNEKMRTAKLKRPSKIAEPEIVLALPLWLKINKYSKK